MGLYIEDFDGVRRSKKIHGSSFSELKRQAPDLLVALCDRGIFKFAVVLPDEAEYKEFHDQYSAGMLLRMDFYSCSSSLLEAKADVWKA